MASGVVELVGSQIGSSGSNGGAGNTIAKVLDGDFTTFYDAANASGDWVGVDAGSAVTVRTVKYAPRRGDSGASSLTQYEDRVVGAKIQASSSATFASDVTDVDTIPAGDSYLSNKWNTRAMTSPPSKQYWRWLGPTSARCNLAELRFLADAGPTSAKPVQPVVSPWGGRYPTGSTTVTITSLTTSAAIYYTTDGTTPTTSSTAYTVPFTLTLGAGMLTLKAIAYDPSLGTTTSDVSTAKFRPWGYKPNEDWEDDHGDLTINTVSGGILREAGGYPKLIDGYYWWYGSNVNRYNNIAAGNYGGHDGVWCYKTTDFLNWVFVGQVLPQQPENDYHVHVQPLWNEANQNIVMWMWQVYVGGPGGSSKWGVASSSTPEGPFTMVHAIVDLTGAGHTAGDTCAYVANSGVGYLVYGDQDAAQLRIVQLSSDFLTTTGSSSVIFGYRVDAPTLIERADGKFLLFYTALNDTNSLLTMSNQLSICSDPTPMGTWDSPQVGMFPDPVGTDFNPQFFIAVRIVDDILMGGDFWVYANTTNSRQTWLPYDATGNGGRGLIVTPSSWDLVSRFGFSGSPPPDEGGTGLFSSIFAGALR